MGTVYIEQSSQKMLEVVRLIHEKSDAIALLFQEDKLVHPTEKGLTEDEVDLLQEANLLARASGVYRPRYRLQRERADVLVTRDFPRNEHDDVEEPNRPQDRVFPWRDEADQIFDYTTGVYENEGGAPARILNMCCGSGSLSFSLSQHFSKLGESVDQVIGIDIEPHVAQRSEFNRQLNWFDGHSVAEDRIKFRQGNLCSPLSKDDQFDLIVAAPPYSLHPAAHTESGRHGGGEEGISVVKPLLEQCGRHLAPGGRLICQCYSLGDDDGPTLVPDTLADALGIDYKEACSSAVKVMDDWKVWRFRDVKCFDHPMPLEYMVVRCADRTYPFFWAFEKNPQEEMQKYVEGWIEKLKKKKSKHGGKYTKLYYVMINYRKPPKHRSQRKPR